MVYPLAVVVTDPAAATAPISELVNVVELGGGGGGGGGVAAVAAAAVAVAAVAVPVAAAAAGAEEANSGKLGS